MKTGIYFVACLFIRFNCLNPAFSTFILFIAICFFLSTDDSWLGDEDRISRDRAQSSPKKKLQERNSFRPTASASTVDSYDAAFQRQPKGVSESKEQNGIDDNFFDT